MNQQEQIDALKRSVATLNAELHHLKIALSYFTDAFLVIPRQPVCGDCGMTMFDGSTCSKSASDCPMGIGIKEAE